MLENLSRIRHECKMTQAELSVKSGVPMISIARYETGKTKPNILVVAKLAKALGVSIEDLVKEG